ncbi:MAG: hypothetical protein IID61_03245 [SAR324 cluster bacterium]|nr:hypothetical protein [SAR324 cluster bacterium]
MEGRNLFGPYLGLWVFGTAFGLAEAAVVVYLRDILNIDGEALFPLLQSLTMSQEWTFKIESYREAATLVLMLTPAYLFSNRMFERFLAYGIIFGLWDLAYYGFLWLFLGWPTSLLTYDVLFMIPTVWVAPVVCPIAIALSLAVFGTIYFLIGRRRLPRNPTMTQVILAIAGGGLVVWSFMNNADYYLAGGMPPNFTWLLFGSGFFIATVSGGYFLGQFIQQPRTRFF